MPERPCGFSKAFWSSFPTDNIVLTVECAKAEGRDSTSLGMHMVSFKTIQQKLAGWQGK